MIAFAIRGVVLGSAVLVTSALAVTPVRAAPSAEGAAPAAIKPAPAPAAAAPAVSWSEPPELAEPSAPAPRPRAYSLKWYGWQTLGVDALALLAVTGGALEPRVALLAIPLYFVPPIIHGGHDRSGLPSLALRIGAPLVGAGVALRASSDCKGSDDNGEPTFCGFVWGLAGVGIGMLAASILDATLLAYEHVDKRHASLPLTPSLELAKNRALLRWSVTF